MSAPVYYNEAPLSGGTDRMKEPAMAEQKREWTEEFRVAGNRVVDRIKELVREGNVQKIIVRKGDGTVLREFRLTEGMAVGGLLALIAPGLAALGALVAFATDLRIQVVRIGDGPDPGRESSDKDAGET